MIIGVLKEPTPETRVSLLPEHVAFLRKLKVEVHIETGAGLMAFATDEKYMCIIITNEIFIRCVHPKKGIPLMGCLPGPNRCMGYILFILFL